MATRADSVPCDEHDLHGSDAGLEAPEQATIMIVDDEPTLIEMLQAFLEDAGYKNFITTTESGPALHLLAKEEPDVVLLDVMMPGITGLEILSWIRSKEALKHVPVLVLTSATDPETKLRALELGATDFLGKPVDASELALRLRNTLAVKAHQDWLSNYDRLTGLPNRRLFTKRLAGTLRELDEAGGQCALIHLGVDRFKQINDTLGYGAGDAVLKRVAARLEECLRDDQHVDPEQEPYLARMGGDEFAILLPRARRIKDATLMARRIRSALEHPFRLRGRELVATAGMGIAIYPTDGQDVGQLLKHAGVAMSHAKRRGNNNYQYYSKELNAKALERLSLENRLRKALDQEELALYFQPKVEVSSGRVVGAEALLRWKHPKYGIITPSRFIPIAEETGLIVPFDEWVMHTACALNRQWQSAGIPPLCVSVNVSSQHFRNADRLLITIRNALERGGLEGRYLCLELTESMIMEDPADNAKTLWSIRNMGVTLSVDDFGTGYSSLSYLKRFPLDELKFDRTFLREIPENADDSAIVSAIIAMCDSLGLTSVAEGVETQEQLAFLRERGCDIYQGYLMSRPLPERDFAALLRSQPAEPERAHVALSTPG